MGGFSQIRVFQPGSFDVFVYGVHGNWDRAPEEYVNDLFEFRRGAPVYVEFQLMSLRSFDQEGAAMFTNSMEGALGELYLQFMTLDGQPVDIQITPEPATFWLTGGLVAAVLAFRRRRR